MKNKILILLLVINIVFMLSACSGDKSSESAAVAESNINTESELELSSEAEGINFVEAHADWPMYTSVDELVERCDVVAIGEIKDISFEVIPFRNLLYESEENPHVELCTIYEIEVITPYKGISSGTFKLRVDSGRDDKYIKEQREAIAGRDDVMVAVCCQWPLWEVGDRGLFCARETDIYYTVINPSQSSYSLDDPTEKFRPKHLCVKDIISYFGQDKWQNFVDSRK